MKKLLPYLLLTAVAFILQGPYTHRSRVVTSNLKVKLPPVDDITRVDGWNARCQALWHQQLHQAARYNQQALRLANQLKYPKGQADAYRCLGTILLSTGNGSYYTYSYLQYAFQAYQQLNDKPGMAATLLGLATYYRLGKDQNKTEKARQSLTRSAQLFRAINDERGLGEVAHQFGEIDYWERNYPAALRHYQQALGIRQRIGDTATAATARTLIRLGDLHALNNQRQVALSYYQDAYRIGQAKRYYQIVADATQGMGRVHQRHKAYPQALRWYEFSLQAGERFYGRKNPWLYQQIAQLYKQQQQYTKSIAYYTIGVKALDEFYGRKDWFWTTKWYEEIGEVYQLQGQYNESLAYLQQAVRQADSVNVAMRASLKAPILNRLGQVHLQQGNFSSALAKASVSLQLATEKRIPQTQQDAHLTLSRIYAAVGNYAQAYAHHLRYTALKDALVGQEIERLATLKNGLAISQKQDQVNLLWQERQQQEGLLTELNQRNYALLAGLLLFCTLVIVLIRHNRRNQRTNRLLAEQAKQLEQQRIRELEQTFEHRQAETEMAALRAQMNPHFIFNCLNSIKLYASENEAVKATDYLTKFARLIRLVLESSRAERVTLSDELEALGLYGEMEAMRFKDKLSCRIEVDPGIDTEFVEIPPLLIQPYVENAIWHGLMHKEAGGTVWVRVEQPGADLLQVTIQDDGVGRAKAAELKSKSAIQRKSFGMKMTGERLALINQLYQIQTRVQIDDLVDAVGQPTGTKVVLQIPI